MNCLAPFVFQKMGFPLNDYNRQFLAAKNTFRSGSIFKKFNFQIFSLIKMRKILILGGLIFSLAFANCSKETETENEVEIILTTPVWKADSLLANGVDASGFGQLLEKFKGEAKFNKDYTGTFGKYIGTWWLSSNNTQITIKSDSLLVPLTCKIVELIPTSFKITAAVPNPADISTQVNIRMTFVPK